MARTQHCHKNTSHDNLLLPQWQMCLNNPPLNLIIPKQSDPDPESDFFVEMSFLNLCSRRVNHHGKRHRARLHGDLFAMRKSLYIAGQPS